MDNSIVNKWYDMPVSVQISNIGSEVNRAISWKNKGNIDRQKSFCDKAISFLELSISDPKNKHRMGEFTSCIEELADYFKGENVYQTTDEVLIKYYDAFLYKL
ncbi:MAG: hypothetical protein Q4E57_01940 [Eubacteriales bacterium]|nr:hypothetical protein [Eubacteriales bacterium]